VNRFSLPEPTPVVLEHLNTRSEQHGDDLVTAIDLKFSMDCGNAVLDLFHPQLRRMLFCKLENQPAKDQGELALGEPPDLPNLRWPQLDALRWMEELTGRTLTLSYGIGGESDIVLRDCRINNLKIEPLEGGTVHLVFRVQCVPPQHVPVIDQLAHMLKREVMATLSGPSESSLPFGDDQVVDADFDPDFREVGGAAGKPEAKDATQAFLDQHG